MKFSNLFSITISKEEIVKKAQQKLKYSAQQTAQRKALVSADADQGLSDYYTYLLSDGGEEITHINRRIIRAYRWRSAGLEGIADGEVERERLTEGDIEIMSRADAGHLRFSISRSGIEDSGAGRVVKTVAEITTDYHHTDIHTQTDTGAESYVAEEGFPLDETAWTHRVILEQPDVAGINEERTMEHTHYRETVFRVELKLEGTRLIEIPVPQI